MKKHIILIITSLYISISCSQKKPELGKLVIYYYDEGQKSEEGHLHNEKKNGEWLMWYPNGQLKQKGNFKSGKLHGLYEGFHINGQSAYKSKYKDGEELHGPIDEGYYKNGRLQWRANYKDEKPHGPYAVSYTHLTLPTILLV